MWEYGECRRIIQEEKRIVVGKEERGIEDAFRRSRRRIGCKLGGEERKKAI